MACEETRDEAVERLVQANADVPREVIENIVDAVDSAVADAAKALAAEAASMRTNAMLGSMNPKWH